MESFVLWSLRAWPARGLNNFISAASIPRLYEAVKVQFSDLYKNVGKTKVLYNFKMVSVLTFLKIVSFVRNVLPELLYNMWIWGLRFCYGPYMMVLHYIFSCSSYVFEQHVFSKQSIIHGGPTVCSVSSLICIP
jgi:hypothetical protein